MPFSYANAASGPSAGGIGWFNFENLTISPGGSVSGLSGQLNDGSTVTFDLSLALTSGQPRTFVAVPAPVVPATFFGSAGYTDLAGNTVLYSDFNLAGPGVNTFTISNITVVDQNNNPVPNYTVVLADSETTNIDESWIWQTNAGPWNLLTTLGSNPPVVNGFGTQTLTIQGTQIFPQSVQASTVATTQTPTQLSLVSGETLSGRQGFSIGFATTRITLQKNLGARIDPSDQFELNIAGTPSDQAITTGAAEGIQTEFAQVFAIPGNSYQLNEAMAAGSASPLSDYTQTVSAANATPGGTVPPLGSLPINFTPALGDDVTYTILNAAPPTDEKTVDKAFSDVGELLTYTVTVNNPNNFPVNNVLVTDAVPTGTVYAGNLTVSAPYTGTDPASGLTITTIEADSSVTITFQVQVNSFPPISNPVTNFAVITVPGSPPGNTNVVVTQVSTAFVGITKAVDRAFARTGDVLTYTFTLNNVGNTDANNVVITDTVPAGTTFVPGSVTGATGTPPALTLLNSIPSGGSATVTYQVQIGPTVPNPNPIPNAASAFYTYTFDPANPNSGSRTAQSNAVSTLVNVALVSITKAVNAAFAAPGDVLTYTLNLQNTGSTAANNVVITDAVPAGTTFVPGSVTGATGTPPTLTLNAPIAAGGNATVTFQVLVDDAIPDPNPIPNTATAAFTFTVSPNAPDGATGDATSNTVTTQVNIADVNTVKAVDKAFAKPGDVLTYTLTLSNDGNTAANNVVLTDAIPLGTSFVPGSVIGATGTPPTLALLAPIAPGGDAVVSYQVRVDELPDTNPIPNTAETSYTFTVNPDVPDGSSGGNTSNTVTTQVNAAEVSTVKAVDKAFAKPGDVLTYTLTLTNNGNTAANNVILADPVPAGTTFVPGSVTGATGTPPTLTLTGPIPANGTAIVTYQVKIGATIPTPNPIANTATTLYSFTLDPDVPNGVTETTRSNTVTTLVSVATLAVTKAVDKQTAYLGDIITYNLAVTNTGNAPANNVVLTDIVTTGVSYIPGSLTGSAPVIGTPAAITLQNPIAPGATVSISFQVRVDAMPNPNPILNRASVTFTYPLDPNEPDVPGTPAVSNQVCTLVFRYNFSQQINDIIESVALQEAALAAIANAEGAKIQRMVAMSEVTAQELLCLNQSLADMMASISLLEALLAQKTGLFACQIDGCSGGCHA